MSWFQRQKEQLRPRRLEHPIFGRMTFMRMPVASRSYWEGRAMFPATGAEIEVFVRADEHGPGDEQVVCFREIARRYPDLWPTLEAGFASFQERWIRRPAPGPFVELYTLSGLSVPMTLAEEMEWDITFDSAQDPEHIYGFEMRGWEPIGEVRMDG
jgi:hypothetical protein